MAPLSRRVLLRAGLGVLSGCGIVPPPAQAVRVRPIGVLFSPSSDALLDLLYDGVRELGYGEGRNSR